MAWLRPQVTDPVQWARFEAELNKPPPGESNRKRPATSTTSNTLGFINAVSGR